jgi:hypothetical protein
MTTETLAPLIPADPTVASAAGRGFRFGSLGTHTSRTLMLHEISSVFASVPPNAARMDHAAAIIGDNCLGKTTASTRRATNQRLGELYALDPAVPLFRVLRRLWDADRAGRPLLALLAALARDPLLAATAPAVVPLAPGAELVRDGLRSSLWDQTRDRLNPAVLDKVVRNAASSWAQSGHLEGRTFKRRRRVEPTAVTLAFAIWLAHEVGFRGAELLTSGWTQVIDCPPPRGRDLAIDAKRLGLIDVRSAGDVLAIDLDRLDPLRGRG